jgi:cytochrome c oxidase cbb3-type subunit 4
MDAGFLRGLYTVIMFVAFIGIVWWAWSARRKDDFKEAANLPLEDDEPTNIGRRTRGGAE